MSGKKLTRKEKKALNKPVPGNTTKGSPEKGSRHWGGIILAIVAFVLYAASLGYQYTLDDYSIILENNSTRKGAGAIAEFFSTSYRYGYIFISDDLYRPFSKFILALEWSVGPSNPLIGHLFNVMLYSFTAVVLFSFLKEISKGNHWFSFFTTLLFIVHPLHTEVVSNIKSIDEMLAFFFGILSLKYAYRYATNFRISYLALSALFFLLALFSKESAITFLAVIPLVIWFFSDSKEIKRWLPVAGALLVTLVFIGIRSKVLGEGPVTTGPGFIDNMLVAANGPLERYTTAIYIAGLYLYKVFIPYPLSFDNSYPQIQYMHGGDWPFIVSLLVLSGLLVYSAISFRKKSMIVFGILFFFSCFSISSNLFILIGTHYGERLMYTPLLGCIISITALAQQMTAGKPGQDPSIIRFASLQAILPLILAAIFAIMTIRRNEVWASNGTLFASGLISAPNSTRVQYYMGNHLIKEDALKDKTAEEKEKILNSGIVYLKKSISLTPSFADAWNKLGLANLSLKNYTEAASSFEKALQYNPTDPVFYNNLGTVNFNTGKYDLAFSNYRKAISLNPRYVDALSNMGSYYGTAGKLDDAIYYFNEALKYDQGNARAHYFLGITYKSKGNSLLSNQHFEQAYALDPSLRK